MWGIGRQEKSKGTLRYLAPGQIRPNPFQPRREFEPDALRTLAESLRRDGMLQPLAVRHTGIDGWELISGERRLRAAIMAGLPEVPCLELEADDSRATALALIENLQRRDLNCFEEAEGMARLIEQFGFTQEQAAARIGKAQATVANKLRLLRLSPAQRERILAAGLTERHARALLRVPEEKRDAMLDRMIEGRLNVAAADRLIAASARRRTATPVVRDVRLFFNTLANAVGVMRRSGIEAVAVTQEYAEYYEYTVRIPKENGRIRSVG